MKRKWHKLLFIIIALFVIDFEGVNAADLICNYKVDYYGKKVPFNISVFKEDKRIKYDTTEGGKTNPNTDSSIWGYMDSFEKKFRNKVFDEQGNFNNCPDLTVCYAKNQYFQIYPDSSYSCNGADSTKAVTETKTVVTTGEEIKDKSATYCTYTYPLRNHKQFQINLTFFKDSNGTNKFKITKINTKTPETTEATSNGYAILTTVTPRINFSLSKDVADSVFKKSFNCSTPIYMCTGNDSSSNVYTFQFEECEPINNAAYSASDSDLDTGGVVEDNSGDSDDLKGIAACEAIGKTTKTGKLIKRIIGMIRFAIPVLVIILSIIDFIKVLVIEDEKVYKNLWSRFIKRCAAAILFFLIPVILKLLFTISGVLGIYEIKVDSIFCYLI